MNGLIVLLALVAGGGALVGALILQKGQQVTVWGREVTNPVLKIIVCWLFGTVLLVGIFPALALDPLLKRHKRRGFFVEQNGGTAFNLGLGAFGKKETTQ